jgi:predicted NUDIX family phosphoesterase
MQKDEKRILEIIGKLEHLAANVLELKQESIPRRPIVIEFCGSPKSGKSSCINSLSLFLRRNKFRTKVLTERASVCPVTDKYDPSFNIWTACSAIAELVEVLSNNAKDYDVVILDRGIFDALCWFNWLNTSNSLDDDDFSSLETFLVMNKWRTVIDLIYVFTANPEISMEREYASLLTRKPGSIMCIEALLSYRTCIENVSKKYQDKFQRIELYDTSVTTINEVNYETTKSILEIIQENITEKVGFISRENLSDDLLETFYLKDAKISDLPLKYDLRNKVEDDQNSVQPIPILVITNKERNKILVVKKNKKTTSKKSPESDKLLIYLGGHTREEDSFNSSDKTLLSLSKLSLRREIKEEIGINYIPPKSENNPLCIWMRDNDRSKKHLALCYLMEVDFSRTKVKLDKNEFMTGGNTKSGMVLDISQILEREKELESWSKLILRELFNVRKQEQILLL